MAYHGIAECFGKEDEWLLGVTVTDGAGSPRSKAYKTFTDAQMRNVGAEEERKAAVIGEHTAAVDQRVAGLRADILDRIARSSRS